MSEQALDLEYAWALNIPEFWIYQGSEYVSDFEHARFLDIPRL